MIALIQRVNNASVEVNSKVVSSIGKGLLVFIGIEKGDSDEDIEYLVRKISQLRIFEDEKGKFNYSVKDIGGDMLVVSQFTLLAQCRKGNRPSFEMAEAPERAKELYEKFIEKLKLAEVTVASGIFGASMKVHLTNDGPVTIIVDSKNKTSAYSAEAFGFLQLNHIDCLKALWTLFGIKANFITLSKGSKSIALDG